MGNRRVIRAAEGCAAESSVLWDSVWDAQRGQADWALAGPNEPGNAGGLRALQAIETAVVLCLFTDRRIDPEHPCYYLADGDVRGWWGDGIDVRADLNEAAARLLFVVAQARAADHSRRAGHGMGRAIRQRGIGDADRARRVRAHRRVGGGE
jgi:hypothetical protein